MKFDEIMIGQTFDSRFYKISKEEIMKFASQFDPQYMHIDEEKASESIFNGIIASGLHTLSLSFKLWTEVSAWGQDVIAGTGINNLRFTKPVYPDDVLYIKAKVIEKKEKKDSGEVTLLLITCKNDGVKVLTTEISALVAK
ncbi:MaoC family dehydratase N-terminal domain-containing protein [Sporosarcina sp. Marseille-Q4063]|uniref:MaoC/PaaZ C-terminal domain-containing protein n=1 Tax=Sporosarcina sp. Marseille-Q4063 TaxID=2810514 RepID=UPI001BAFA3EA|nr:MaoC/PaaZ C-terminal domain-containing protein [Sporosarcina sp. Marseille-Q4063]QUW21318.1 MaoC family dehydratase N-terminal domain-containing protein [Sporosarcina sp. Marseille-Q4063]